MTLEKKEMRGLMAMVKTVPHSLAVTAGAPNSSSVLDLLCREGDGEGFHLSLKPVENTPRKGVIDGVVDRGAVG